MQIISKSDVVTNAMKLELDIRANRDEVIFNGRVCKFLGIEDGSCIGFGREDNTLYVFKTKDCEDFFVVKKYHDESLNLRVKIKNLSNTLGVKEDIVLIYNKEKKQDSEDGETTYFAFSSPMSMLNSRHDAVSMRRDKLLKALANKKTKKEVQEMYYPERSQAATFYADWNSLVREGKIKKDDRAMRNTKIVTAR